MAASRKKKDQEYLDEAIKDTEQVPLDLPSDIEYEVKQDKKGQVVKRNAFIFEGDIYKLIFPFICDMTELTKLKSLCKGIKKHIESHIVSFSKTHEVKMNNFHLLLIEHDKKGEKVTVEYKLDFIEKNNLKLQEVFELNLIELYSFLSLLDKEFDKPLSRSKRFKDLFNRNSSSNASKAIFLVSFYLSMIQVALIINAIESMLLAFLLPLSPFSVLLLINIYFFGLIAACICANIIILGGTYIAMTQEKQDIKEIYKSNFSSCSKDILKAFEKIKKSDFLICKENKSGSESKLDTVGEVKNFVSNRIFVFEKIKLREKEAKQEKLKKEENKDPSNKVSK